MNLAGPDAQSGVTGGNGCVTFTVTKPGNYTLTEAMKTNWFIHSPASGEYSFAVTSGFKQTYTFVNDYVVISIDKVTVDGTMSGDGLTILTGEPIVWRYTVTNDSNVPLSGVNVTDSEAGVVPAYVSGDTNDDGKLDLDETWIYEAEGIAGIGDYSNTGTASGSYTDDLGNTSTDTDTDDSSYFGAAPSFTVAKACKENTEPIPQEGPAHFTVTFYNDGNVDLTIEAHEGIGTFELAVGEIKSFDVAVPGSYVGVETVYNQVFATGSYEDDAGHTWSETLSDDATCRVGSRVNVRKLTAAVDPSLISWTFAVWEGADGFGGHQLASASTNGSGDIILNFGNLNLDGEKSYTLCEHNLPAGWMSYWQVDSDGDSIVDATLTPYNPDYDPNPNVSQDYGNRCVDFGAGTGVDLLTDGGTLLFEVNNVYGEGGQRTPGYWKNWNSCTGGGQAATAAASGGWENGFWLLEDVIREYYGGAIVWDDILADSFLFQITDDDCDLAVNILSALDTDSGANMNSDAAYTLAKHLLAAQLNFGADAKTCSAAFEAADAAEALLDKVNFDATGKYLRPQGAKDDYYYALDLAKLLDAYNNGLLCVGPEDDNDPPAVTITSHANGDVVSGAEVIIAASATDADGVDYVAFFVDGISIGVDSDGTDGWSVSWDSTSVADGAHTLTAKATDTAGKTGSASVSITVDNVVEPPPDEPPTVDITDPADGDTVSGAEVIITADASDDYDVAQVAFFVGDTSIDVDSNGTDGWSVTWDSTSVANGAHTLSAMATDTAGKTGSASISVTVDNVVDPPVEDPPVEEPTDTVTVTGLDGSSSTVNKNFWKATIVVTIDPALAEAVVSGAWSNGISGTCTTDASGVCTVESGNVSTKVGSIAFTVSDVALAGYTYVPSSETEVTIPRP